MNPVLALIIANIIWGAGAPIFKLTLENVSPFFLAFSRFFFAAVLFLPLYLKHYQKIKLSDFLTLLVGSLLGISLHIPLFFFGIQKTLSINAPIIFSSAPVFLYFLSILFLKEKSKSKVLSGMLIALTGVLVIILSPFILEGGKFGLGEVEGNLLLVLSSWGLIAHTLIFKRLLNRLNYYVITFWSLILGSVPLLPLYIRDFQSSASNLNSFSVFGILFGVLFSSFAAYLLFHFGLSKINAEEVGIFTYVDPVAALILAGPLLGEYPNSYFLLGSFLVFGGIFLAENRLHWHPLHKLKPQTS